VGVVSAASFLAIRSGAVEPERSGLLGFQLAKLDAAPDGAVLLVGDSSLGNAVNAAAWSQALQRPVVNAALTGEFGYPGSLNLLRRALRRFRPSLVIVFHTLEMPRRLNEWKGLVYTAETPGDLAEAPGWETLAQLANLDLPAQGLRSWLAGRAPSPMELSATDYVPQRPPGPDGLRPGVDGRRLAPSDVREEAMETLDAIGAACRAAGVPCLYAHGPYVEPFCSENRDFVAAAGQRIERAGLRVVAGTPRCMPRADAGDSEDHIAPELEAAYSEIYRRLVLEAAGWQPRMATAPAR